MAQVESRQRTGTTTASVAGALLAADVGGTHARIGLVGAGVDRTHPVSVIEYRKYVCADYPSLDSILAEFLASLGGVHIEHGVIACAGYLLDDMMINTNLLWPVSLSRIRSRLGLRSLDLINDFEAIAYATLHLDPAETVPLTHAAATQAPTLVVGPGTGLGAAVCIPGAHGPVILATEAGQAAFAPSTQIELDVLGVLYRRSTYVGIEHLLSGPGLVNLYAALCELRGEAPALFAPTQITESALRGSDPRALQTLQVFCGLMGSVLGDLALLYGAHGGVYLAGGIVPQIKDFLLRSTFVERFLNKGRMREPLERVPVRLIEHGRLGVIGAASWYLHRRTGANGGEM